ncbi:disease resistance protein RUN1-like [Rhodamnia argentea]|uniref:Disease resistance protein RUN1-like n=1 Tax=Rhodamnia argentea TaxID=178133 RepID=A0ABM3HBU6_9MYRT|nr:disease resistance protein RUN1-like [Rhodamnia argentea]
MGSPRETRKDKVQALNLVEHHSDPISITDEELERMPNLKSLKLRAGTFVGDIDNHLLELRWLSWDSPPVDCRMANLHLKNLVVFKLSDNKNTENWGGWNILKMANKLKVLSLTKCEGLKRTPDFSGCLNLERLSLDACPNLQEVDPSIGKLKGLVHLDIIWCESLQTLPEEIGGLVNLKHFSMQGCHEMEKLPCSIGKLESLSELDVSSSKIKSLPDSIGNAKHLSFINLTSTPIGELPISIGELTQLEFLSLHRCRSLGELPESTGNLTALEKLYLSETSIVKLPDSIKNLKQLKVMRMGRSHIRRLPATIEMLERLEELHARGCEQLAGELPTEIGKLLSLRILDMSNTHVCAVPAAINSLTRLQELNLTDCNELQELPKLPPSLNCLRVQSTSLRLVPDLGNLTNLVELNLSDGYGLALARASNPMQTRQLQWVGKLSKLESLRLCLSDVPVPSSELGCLPQLRELTLSGMDSFNSAVVGPQFSNLKNLLRLCLYRCPLREIQLDGLELLRDLTVEGCKFLKGLSIISSSLRKLREMEVVSCPRLLEIRFLSTMESLEKLKVRNCDSLGGLCGLSNLKKLKTLKIYTCDGLRVVEGLEGLELLNCLSVYDCGSLERLIDVSNSKIPNECRITISCCAKLSTYGGTYGDYGERILREMDKTINESPPRTTCPPPTTSSDVSKCPSQWKFIVDLSEAHLPGASLDV